MRAAGNSNFALPGCMPHFMWNKKVGYVKTPLPCKDSTQITCFLSWQWVFLLGVIQIIYPWPLPRAHALCPSTYPQQKTQNTCHFTCCNKAGVCVCVWAPACHLTMVNLHFPMVESSIFRYFFSQIPKCHFFLFQNTNVYLCANFGDDRRRATFLNLDLFLNSQLIQHSTRKLQFSFDQMRHKS